MYTTEIVIIIGFTCYILGVLSTLVLDRRGLSIEQVVSLAILVIWITFTMIGYTQDRELSIFFNAAGMGAVGNLLGIKTTELVSTVLSKVKPK